MTTTSYRLTNFCGNFSSPIGVLHYLQIPRMTTDSKKYTTIVIDKQTYSTLKNLRNISDKSFDTVINRLVKSANNNNNNKRQESSA